MDDLNADGEDTTTPPPVEEERRTETVDDEVKPKEEPGPESSQPDVSARLDSIEKELAALKAMMDTLGYEEPAAADDDGDGGEMRESIEDLFD